MSTALPLTRRAIFAQAWPIMLGQASIPLVGIVDTAVIGRSGDAAALAGVALGATLIGLVFWSFGFLRMGMTGLTSQAHGAGERDEVEALLLRGIAIGLALGVAIVALQVPLGHGALALMAGGERVSAEAAAYMHGRFLGAPAALTVYALTGWLFGLGRTRDALALQLVMNAANAGFDLWFVLGFDWGAFGVGAGTALAELVALITGLALVGRDGAGSVFAFVRRATRAQVLDPARLKQLFAVNRDIMIRTVSLLLLFVWFANAGARLGAAALAANHVLLQFVNVAAFVLDAFAFTAEARVGNAVGKRSRADFTRAIRLAGEFSLLAGALLSALFLLAGGAVIDFLTTEPQVREAARSFLPFAALIPLIGMPSWMLDGAFIGATQGRALRNAAVFATLSYIALDLALRSEGQLGLWIAFSASYLLRAVALGVQLPRLARTIGQA
ncbi:MATE family efflux transporter [Aurantiacibacter suaedae]|uniref:MATE family efflux transporter n=1 Tax=Aurantiacibacter suaedae TaxID=2545755 RepID=UPI001F4FF79F|nr:MATE family efflux transporter [Aurantiacibacter suaedae]